MSKELLEVAEEWGRQLEEFSNETVAARAEMRSINAESRRYTEQRQLRRRVGEGVGFGSEHLRRENSGSRACEIVQGEKRTSGKIDEDGPIQLGEDCTNIDGWVERVFSEPRRIEGLCEGDEGNSEIDARESEESGKGYRGIECGNCGAANPVHKNMGESPERLPTRLDIPSDDGYVQQVSLSSIDFNIRSNLTSSRTSFSGSGLGGSYKEPSKVVAWLNSAFVALLFVLLVAVLSAIAR